LAFFTRKGIIKKTKLSEYSNIRNNGVKAINLDENDELITTQIADKDVSMFFIVTANGMCIKFKKDDVRDIGRVARGVTGIKLKEDDYVVGAISLKDDNDEILTVSQKGRGKRTTAENYRLQSRSGKGIIGMKLTTTTGNIIGVVTNDENMDLMALTNKGKMIRVDMHTIRKAGRNTSGVKIVSIEGEDKVVSVATCPKENTKDEEEIQNKDILEQ
jgi:DNA gyrase subunit A